MAVAEPKLEPVYFDSALIAMFYLDEPAREQVRQVARSAGAVVSSGIRSLRCRLEKSVFVRVTVNHFW